MPLCTRAAFRSELLVVAGLLLLPVISACVLQKSQPLPADADTVIQMGPGGTPRLVQGEHLAADLEGSAAYEDARRNRDYGEMARRFLAQRADLFKLADPKADLRLIAALPDGLGHHHAKFQQVVGTIPVWKKTLSVHFDSQDRLYRVDGDYLPTPIAVDTRPTLSMAQAQAEVLGGLAGTGTGWKVEAGEMIIYVTQAAAPRLAYRFTLGKGLSGREDRIVAADNGQLLKRLSRINY
jgi:Zn-dependent metalloprotease